MTDAWETTLSCAVACARCSQSLKKTDPRILSSYDHTAICIPCKHAEEKRADYEEVSKQTVGQCLADTETAWGDAGGYCYHHFYPYTCKSLQD